MRRTSKRRSVSGALAVPRNASSESCAKVPDSGWNDQWLLLIFSSAIASIWPGQTAPCAIHFLKVSISAAERRSPFGGIFTSSSVLLMTSIRWLPAASPGTTAAPKSPPFNNAARLSNRSPAFCFSGPWHSKQRFARTGRISFSKSGAAASESASGASTRAARSVKVDLTAPPESRWMGVVG